MLKGSSRNEIPYRRMIPGAMLRMLSVGVMKMRTNPLGTSSAVSVQTTPNTAADAGQQAQTVNDVPDRGDYGQRRRLVRRPLILPHHGGVYYAVAGRDQDAAKGGEVFEVDWSDLIRQEIAREDCLAGSICRVQKGLDKLLPYPAHHFQQMICPPSKQSVL